MLNIPMSIITLAIGSFGIGLAEFLIMGLLPEVAAGMNVSLSQAGYFISAYALGVVVGAPLLSIFGRTMTPKYKLIVLMIIFTIANGLSAVAPNAEFMMLFRFMSGLPHGAFLGLAGVVATRIAGPGKSASALALMLSGLTISNVIGVPLATFVGHEISWRVAFSLICGVGLLSMLSVLIWVPTTAKEPKKKLTEEFVIFKKPMLWALILFSSIGYGGFFAWFSYIAPVLTQVTQVASSSIPYLLALAGLGMTFGNWLGGKIGDRMAPIKMAIMLTFSMLVILALNALLAPYIWPMYFLTFLAGANSIALTMPIQILLIDTCKESPFLGSALGHGAFNIGNSVGAFAGGIPLALGYNLISPWWVGVGLTAVGIGIVFQLKKITPTKFQEEPVDTSNIALH